MGYLLVLYAGLLVYGSLYPFAWGAPLQPLFAFLHAAWPAHLDKGDIVQNVLVYMPFGLLVVAWRGHRTRFPAALLLAAVAGTAISFGVETVQQFLPARVPSLVDVATNLLGSVIGALLGALVSRHTSAGANVLGWRDAWFRPGPLANTGLVVLGLWFLSQTSPLVPSLDIAQLRHGLGIFYRSVTDPFGADVGKFCTLLCYQAGLGILLCSVLAPGRPLLGLYVVATGFVCVCKLLVAGRVLSLELVAAAACALPVLALARNLPPRVLAGCGVVLLALGLAIYELVPGIAIAGIDPAFNWIPFQGQMNGLSGFENILEFLWPAMGMAVLLRLALPFHRQDAGAVIGTVTVALGIFVLEWLQQSVPGRYGDITQALLACVGWIVPWCVRVRLKQPAHAAATVAARRG